MAEGDTAVNAIIGAVVGAVVSMFFPLGPLVGGGVSGYLQGGDRNEGLRIGAIAGAITLIPLVLLFAIVGPLFFAVAGGMFGLEGLGIAGGIVAVFFLIALVFGVVVTIALSALGGYLGNYVKYDTDFEL